MDALHNNRINTLKYILLITLAQKFSTLTQNIMHYSKFPQTSTNVLYYAYTSINNNIKLLRVEVVCTFYSSQHFV